jgi:hypothetical protein
LARAGLVLFSSEVARCGTHGRFACHVLVTLLGKG